MLKAFFLLLFVVMPLSVRQSQAAGLLPSQIDICSTLPEPGTDTNLSKSLLANYILVGNTYAIKRIFSAPLNWNLIFTTEQRDFCAVTAVCRGLTPDACTKQQDVCNRSQNDAVLSAIDVLSDLTDESKNRNANFKVNSELANSRKGARPRIYFASPNDDSGIVCTAPKNPKAPQSPAAADKSPFRLRGVADDLYIDRGLATFKSTSQATLTVSGDHSSSAQTQTAKIKGAIGYAFDVNGLTTAIPYFSFYQSLTDTKGKSQTIDPTSNVAGGLLFTTTIPGDAFVQVISAKPQFLQNTKDQSQIGSLRLSYTPYTDFDISSGGINLNAGQPIPFLPFTSYGQLIADVRVDIGQYTDRGNDPVQRLLNKDFGRAGSRFGYSISTDPTSAPSFTFVVAETLLYGFMGSVRNLDLFETSLTYNFDTKNYLGLTASYRKGRDEDTALKVQTWLVGLSARY